MGTPGATDDALRRLEERLGRASEAAERLIAEAAGTARAAAGSAWAGAGSASSAPGTAGSAAGPAGPAESSDDPPAQPPPAGWQSPRTDADRQSGDLELLLAVVQSLRELIPPELERRLAEALRELLLALRALIDWYLERSERRRTAASEVQDIPIL